MSNPIDNKNFWEKYSNHLIHNLYNGRVTHSLTKIERKFAKKLNGRILLPFCNFGMNTFCLEDYGSEVIGLDF